MKIEGNIEGDLDHLDLTISPEEARSILEYQGFEEGLWDKIMKRGMSGLGNFGSHETKALIIIARGKEPQVLGSVYRQLREEDGLPPKFPSI